MWGWLFLWGSRAPPCLPPCLSGPRLHASDVPPALATHTGWWDGGALTRVGPASAEVQARERAAVAGVQGRGAGEVELVQGHGAVEYVLWRQRHGVNTGVFGSSLPCAPRRVPLPGCSPGSQDAERTQGLVPGAGGAFQGHVFRKKEGGSICRGEGTGTLKGRFYMFCYGLRIPLCSQ